MKCPICNTELNNKVCNECGFYCDFDRDNMDSNDLFKLYESIKEQRSKYHKEKYGLDIVDNYVRGYIGKHKNIVIPDGVTSIKENAFLGCTEIESIYVPKTVSSIGSGAFTINSEGLKISIDENNEWYYCENNCVIEKATGTIITGTLWGGIPTNNNVTTIGSGAFQFCTTYGHHSGGRVLIIPSNITKIFDNAFLGAGDFEYIIIPKSVNEVGENAFLCFNGGIYCESNCKPIAWHENWCNAGADFVSSKKYISITLSNQTSVISKLKKLRFESNDKIKWGKEEIVKLTNPTKDISSIDIVDRMEGHEFERCCAKLLEKNGYSNIHITQGSGDQGIDIIAYRDGIKHGIQCKCYNSPIGNKAVQEVFAGKAYHQCHVGIVMTNSTFTTSAKELAKRNGITLWDRNKLIKMINKSK